MDFTREDYDLMDTVWFGEICATFGHKFPDVCYVQHTLSCV